jgi:hypothetical protein
MIAVAVLAYMFYFAVQPPAAASYTRGFADYIRRNADVEAIRAWAASLPTDADPAPSTWPPAVRELSPVYVVWSGRERQELCLAWGGGFGHWGLTVDPKEDRPPHRPGLFIAIDVAPGAYVWNSE